MRKLLGVTLLAAILCIGGCAGPVTHDPPEEDGKNSQDAASRLVHAVYGGLGAAGEWVSLAFQTEGRVSAAFSSGGPAKEWTYACQNSRSGSIDGAGSPGAFTLSEDGAALAFANFNGQGGEKRFDRLRKSDLTPSPSPAGLAALPANLEGSVWGGGTPQAENSGYLVLAFKAGMKAAWFFSVDAAAGEWDYTCANNAGAVTAGTGWPPGAFTIDGGGNTLTFTSYGGHAGEKIFFRYYQAEVPAAGLAGTVWQWEHRAFYFITGTAVEYHRMAEFGGAPPAVIPYAYSYDPRTRQGEIEVRGRFRVSEDGQELFFPDYTSYGHGAVFDRVEEALWPKGSLSYGEPLVKPAF
ncbi:MAG: hypothetical protein LBD37_04730 [Treponema sp.]|jgi:hypothetical protein|nr:hypothetical protein [Treponema sp.]